MEPLSMEASKGSSYLTTAIWFAAGGAVTAIFSGSLAKLTTTAELPEVLMVGMVVPSFTWVVQMGASWALMSPDRRRLYWGDLGRICLWGSVALLPAAVINLFLSNAPRWLSAANVLASVAIMGADLFRRSARHQTPWWWPLSWCCTITVNMMLFLMASWSWWAAT
ncbi:hypothetical protein [Zavarzinella formosa]|uniref:hypothetical protein n=1 Tax=Zavarzinella formosa TaxID=360055 RepID=UPI0002FF67CA|nr:hypothetical protein [Zavarzinella formosa]